MHTQCNYCLFDYKYLALGKNSNVIIECFRCSFLDVHFTQSFAEPLARLCPLCVLVCDLDLENSQQSDCLIESLVHFKHHTLLYKQRRIVRLVLSPSVCAPSSALTLGSLSLCHCAINACTTRLTKRTYDRLNIRTTTHCSESVTKVILIIFIYDN